eukprot:TRINITY_DN3056_c0_g1_i2.p3 TRINITY_DN3056_c0_g1~~TRINITY_DN3056_c0_g1_i2.p3  ORF type:complete len:101 (-),score=31.71 TRINITY_DN3056_c0_g1_i2:70-372(-)
MPRPSGGGGDKWHADPAPGVSKSEAQIRREAQQKSQQQEAADQQQEANIVGDAGAAGAAQEVRTEAEHAAAASKATAYTGPILDNKRHAKRKDRKPKKSA